MLTGYSFEEAQAAAENIEGWLDISEAKLLYETASSLKGNGVIVEIGSWCSKSLTYLVSGALSCDFCNKIYSIDPFLTSKDEPNGKYETFICNLKENNLYDKITHIKEKSQIAGKTFNESIELLFIDGFHQYYAVKQDFDLFYPKIIEGGHVAVHDVNYYQGPTDLILEYAQSDTFKIMDYCHSTVLAQKVRELTEEDKINNKKFAEEIKLHSSYRALIQ